MNRHVMGTCHGQNRCGPCHSQATNTELAGLLGRQTCTGDYKSDGDHKRLITGCHGNLQQKELPWAGVGVSPKT